MYAERKQNMATYLKTKSRIQAQIRLRGIKVYKTFPDKKSARAWATNKEQEILKGKSYEVDRALTLKDLLLKYKSEYSQFKSRPKQEENQIDRLITKYKWLVDSAIINLTVSDFIKFKSLRVNDKGNSSSTNNFRATNGDLILIGSVYKKAIEVWNMGIELNPIKHVEKYPSSTGRYRPIKHKEYKTLLRFGDSEFNKVLLTYRLTGMRPSEAHRLTVNDIDRENQKLVIRKAKGNKSRTVDCNKFLLNYLYKANQEKLLPISQSAFKQRLKRAIKKLNIHDLIPYDFRRARIQKLVDSGKPIGYVALQVGHNSFEMLARYYGIKLR